MIISLGIDPGMKGAIFLIKENEIKFIDMPIHSTGEIDAVAIKDFLLPYVKNHEKFFGVIEKAQYMPKFNARGELIRAGQNTFHYGEGYGKVKAVLDLLKIPYQEVRPALWKKEYSLNDDKRNSVIAAEKLFPDIKKVFRGPRGGILDGRAEACLLAEYARRIYKE